MCVCICVLLTSAVRPVAVTLWAAAKALGESVSGVKERMEGKLSSSTCARCIFGPLATLVSMMRWRAGQNVG